MADPDTPEPGPVPDPVTAAPPPTDEAVRVFGDRLAPVREYADLLATTGISHGLLGPREAARLWDRHLVNCALLESLLPQGARVVDIGSGAGLPGLVLALVRPDLEVHLVEPLLRRTTWLQAAVEQLSLGTVTVHRGRAPEIGLTAPYVTARAVASLDKLVTWSMPLLEPGGRLLALKGEVADRELAAAAPVLARFGVTDAVVRVVGEGLVSEPLRVVDLSRPVLRPARALGGRRGRAPGQRARRRSAK